MGVVTGFILLYCVLILLGVSVSLIQIVFLLFPVFMIWLVYTVLRHGRYEGDELQHDEEWGYEDKDRTDLGTF